MLGTAQAEEQEQEQGLTLEEKVLDSVMGAIGLSRIAKPGIDYRERSPLVIPRDDKLPPPETSKVADPNWPVDPEIKQARALAAANKRTNGRTSSDQIDDESRPLPRSELEKGRTTRRQNNPSGGDDRGLPLSWSELGYSGGIFSGMFGKAEERPASFTGEAPRTSLITPPPGYQTPSPAQPYALGKSTYKDKPIDYYTDRDFNNTK